MDSREMIFKLPHFEQKKIGETNWKKVPEKEFLLNLCEDFTLITPVLANMFEGIEVISSSKAFRIKSESE